MSFISNKTLKFTASFLHKVQIASFARNVKLRPMGDKLSTNPMFENVKQFEKQEHVKNVEKKRETGEFQFSKVQHAQQPKPERIMRGTELLQSEIIRARTPEAIFSLFQKNKDSMDIINVCTCLNNAISLENKSDRAPKDTLANNATVKEIISHLKERIHQMNDFSMSNFLSNLVKLEIFDQEIIEAMVTKILEGKIKYSDKALAYITWSLAKSKNKNEAFLDLVAKKITAPKAENKAKHLSFIFWAMSELDYKSKSVMDLMNKTILESAERFDLIDITLVFAAYNNYRNANHDVLDTLSQFIIRHTRKLSLRTLANITNYCANLDYVNNTLLTHLEREFVFRLKQTPEIESIMRDEEGEGERVQEYEEPAEQQENSLAETQTRSTQLATNQVDDHISISSNVSQNVENPKEMIKLIDVTQILTAFCKLKVIKSELFELLELHFIRNLDKATAESMVSYTFAHSSLCNEMFIKYQENKKTFIKRSLKNLKKYNHTFYETLAPFLKQKSLEFKPEEAFSVLVSASRPLISKRAIKRELLEFGVMNIPKLEALRSEYTTLEFEKFVYKYNLMLQKFAFKSEHILAISEGFKQIDVNISLIDKAYNIILGGGPIPDLSKENFFPENEEEEESDDEETF